MIYEVAADGGVNSHGHGDFEFGADAIGAGDEDRFLKFFVIEGEEPAESTDATEDGGREGAAGEMTNALLGVIGYGDIDSGIRVFHGEAPQQFDA